MPNGSIHKTAAAILVPIVYLVIQNNSSPKEEVDFSEIILSSLVGVGTARIPDILEPPIHPNHRDFFHSIVFGGITVYIGTQVWKDLQLRRSERITLGSAHWDISEFVEIAILIACSSVVLHLILDGFTPKGLNFI